MKVIKKVVKSSLVLAMLGGTSVIAQSLTDVKKAIDAEQYQKASTTLKGMISSKPADAESYFYLGNLYLKGDYADSAKATFTNGVNADAKFPLNYVGLGAVALKANNSALAQENFKKALDQAGRKDNDPYIYIAKAYIAAPKPDYATAITHLQKAIEMDEKDAEAQLALGDAYRGQQKASEAFSAYRTAYDLNKDLLRAKIELGVINKSAQAWQESIDEFKSVLAINPNYGPAYREMAETYLRWANTSTESADYESRIKQALDSYVKYMDMTDRSLESRMRYADFLVLSKDFKTLEKEAQEMARLDQTNTRIYRYLGYSAYENAHYDESLKALNNWISKADPERLIAYDYLYLGKTQLKTDTTGKGIANLAKAVDMDSTLAEQMSEIGKSLFADKKYNHAAQVYELALKGPKPSVTDRFYVGYSHYFNFVVDVPDAQKSKYSATLVRADSAFSNVSKVVPDYALAYIYRARVNRLLDNEDNPKGLAVPHYEKFIQVQAAVAPEKLTANNKKDLVDAYNYLGAYYIKTEASKSRDYFKKTLELDPANAYATSTLKALASQ